MPPRDRSGTDLLRPAAAVALAIAAMLLGACAGAPAERPRAATAGVVGAERVPSGTRAPRALSAPAAGAAPTDVVADARLPLTDDAVPRRLERLYARARELVGAETGTDLSEVSLALVDGRVIDEEVGAETRRLVHGRLGRGAFPERLIGALSRGQAGSYVALYSGRERAVLVGRELLDAYLASLPPDPELRTQALTVLLLHELVHAADDLRHGIHDNRSFDFRASFTQSAVFEGHAQWRTRRICRRHGCLEGLAALDAFMFGDATAGPRVDGQDLLEYSYVEGERFVAALAAREGGAALVERALAEPPRDPLQVLDPASYPNLARERRNGTLLAAARTVPHPWLSGERVVVETSPLKGVNLRGDPERRRAAVDGFTRLLVAAVAVQFHDPRARRLAPIEVTLMHAETPAIARLFADTLYAHALSPGGEDGQAEDAAGGFTLRHASAPEANGSPWRTVVGNAGSYVVRASGPAASRAPLESYVRGALEILRRIPS